MAATCGTYCRLPQRVLLLERPFRTRGAGWVRNPGLRLPLAGLPWANEVRPFRTGCTEAVEQRDSDLWVMRSRVGEGFGEGTNGSNTMILSPFFLWHAPGSGRVPKEEGRSQGRVIPLVLPPTPSERRGSHPDLRQSWVFSTEHVQFSGCRSSIHKRWVARALPSLCSSATLWSR